jgi:hypothetical protein
MIRRAVVSEGCSNAVRLVAHKDKDGLRLQFDKNNGLRESYTIPRTEEESFVIELVKVVFGPDAEVER